jgi:hypothetical protein
MFGKPRGGWDYNIKVDIQELDRIRVRNGLIDYVQFREKCRAVVKTVMNFTVA